MQSVRWVLLCTMLFACDGTSEEETDGGTDATVGSCAGLTDGTACGAGVICASGACVESACGDEIVDARTEECDDGNDAAFDGCEPGTCTFTCAEDLDCDDGATCSGVELCAADHVCLSGTALEDGTPCTLASDEPGMCRSGRCVRPMCGDSVVESGESCDDGNTTPDDGCEIDCRFTCETDPGATQTWYVDCDGDGYAVSDAATQTSCLAPAPSGCGGGWTRRTPMSGSADCDDANADLAVLRCYEDEDHDEYAAVGAMQTAPGCPPIGDGLGYGGCPTGYTSRDPAIAGNADCDAANPNYSPAGTEVCVGGELVDEDCDGMIDEDFQQNRTFYVDADGDNYGAGDPVILMVSGCQPSTYVPMSGYSVQAGDCCDSDSRARPGQTVYIGEARMGCGGFDFDCNGVEQKETRVSDCYCDGLTLCRTLSLPPAEPCGTSISAYVCGGNCSAAPCVPMESGTTVVTCR